ncbi:T9SS type A sorting domain-containing protein [Longitalea luteola]|uniref:T9SS type A sorting domain-containing protein n=1 Tax=Longitalea luteola TaxID=2812563 RepID=UPI001A9585D9|nr:T9SS type A sorting domain-containing protein [Longitalea luteola]
MRKFLFILSLLTAGYAAKAQNYTVDLTGLTFEVKEGVKNNTSSHLNIDLILENGSTLRLYSRHLGEEGDRENGWRLAQPVTVSSRPVEMHTEGFVNFRSGTDADYDIKSDIDFCSSNYLDIPSGSPRMTSIRYTVKVTPLLSISANSTILPDNDKIRLTATAGFPASVYNWYYWTSTNGWLPFPAAINSAGRSTVDVMLTDFIQGSPLSSITQNTFFKVQTCASVASNLITLSNRLSSPRIIGLDVQPNKCFGESNGYVKIRFDRAIVEKELLNIFLEDTTNPNGYNSSVINLTTAGLAADNSYTWPAELPPGGYKITLIGKYPNSSTSTYTDGPGHVGRFGFEGPTALSYTASKRDVYCFGGSDAMITVNASGGVGNYRVGYKKMHESTYNWIAFSAAGTHTISGLDTGSYNISVRDGNDCMMKDGSGQEVIRTITINQPAEALHIDNAQPINPLAFGYTDGSIRVILSGGTPVNGDSYDLQWKTIADNVLTPEPATTDPFTTVLKNIGDGKYILFATDGNYALTSGADAEGCMVKDTFTLTEPPPLIVTVEQYRYVSCKNFADGKLYAKAQGGIEIPIFRYQYQWFRNDNGVWTDIQQDDSIAVKLKAGEYKIIITDKNNITKESAPFTLVEPDLLTLTLSSTPLNCNGSNNGTASAEITGGTGPYHLEWTTGETTTTISNLAQGNYKAFVKDTRNCQTETQIKVTSPDPVEISNVIVKDPTCYLGADGAISYTATGGTLPYNYKWSNGATSATQNKLPAGKYRLTLTDSKNCPLEHTFTVNETAPVVIELPQAITLCVDQVYEADATIPRGNTYEWTGTNNYSAFAPKVKLTNEGTYYVTATNVNGCIGKDTLRITRSNAAVAAEMVATTQAFTNEVVSLVNISQPAPEKVEWLLPSGNVTVVSKNDEEAQLRFADTGLYIIGLRTMVGACEKTVKQPITIVKAQQFDQPGAVSSPFIREFTVAPNPSNGQFTVKVALEEAASIKLRLIQLNTGIVVHQQQQNGSKQYQLPYNVQLNAGVYSLVLETAKEYRIIKIIIQ